ncbi:reverse transcriptase and recombinase [Plakobranchus ocellatus]|uniref:Reverse transcriptase and recombinase n=1 Tax=Plakobranchus ocellatus TaxID=259542 RepID=A0AAV4B807_9GAST|nr:reverse transcriptase and recombinase [Plakobranchus ocellatus]
MSCINKMGSSRSEKLNFLTKRLWEWCTERKIWVSAGRIVGRDNVEADLESRRLNLDMEWRLDPNLLQSALRLLDTDPSVDLIASRLNHQFYRFVSCRPDPDAFSVDAFLLSW